MSAPWNQVADDQTIATTIAALANNGITAQAVATGQEAKEKVLAMLPLGAEVFTMTSVTLDTLGIAQEIQESGKYQSVRNMLNSMNRETQAAEMRKLGAAPEWALGSAHAVTQDGSVLIASNTGSQLSAYVYGAAHVIWVVGAQKIVLNFDQGLKRIYEYVLPLESERARKAYGVEGSNVSKLLVINKEVAPKRLNMIIIKEAIGF